VDSIAYRTVVEAESGRFLQTLASVDLDAAVPSCPGWKVADLLWHLAEVHGFWAEIVDRLLEDPAAADELERPPDQAHEALIHRTDAELAAGVTVTRPSAALAADGVDELIRGFIVGVPDWATWTPDGTTLALECTDVAARYVLELGRITGTSPASGRSYDLDAAELRDDPSPPVDAEVSGDAWELDRWLWGRGDATALTITGALEIVTRFRALVTEATQ
jgi:hypothetical protein